MRFLFTDECQSWCRARGIPVAGGLPDLGSRSFHRFSIPSDAGRRVALARTLWESIAEGAPETLLWVTECGVWPSGEHLPLAEAARASWGATTALAQQPGHIVFLGESDRAVSLLVLAVLFLWDLWLFPGGSSPAAHISHDEFGLAWFSSSAEHQAFANRLVHLGA